MLRLPLSEIQAHGFRTAGYFQVGETILYGKWKNKKGLITWMGLDDRGLPAVTIQPLPEGHKQPKTLQLFTIRKAPQEAEMERTAGTFEAPPELWATLEPWMIKTYCGNVLAYVNHQLVSSDPVSLVEKEAAYWRTQFPKSRAEILRAKPGALLKYPVKIVDGNRVIEGTFGFRFCNDRAFLNDRLVYYPAFKSLPTDTEGCYQYTVGTPRLNWSLADHAYTLPQILHLLDTGVKHLLDELRKAPIPPKSPSEVARLESLQRECLKYTTTPYRYAQVASYKMPVNLTGWKYLREDMPLLKQLNAQIEQNNEKLRKHKELSIANYHAATQFSEFVRKHKLGPHVDTYSVYVPEAIRDTYRKLLQDLDATEENLNRLYYGAKWTTHAILWHHPNIDGVYLSIRGAQQDWTPIENVHEEPLITWKDVQKAFNRMGINQITCNLNFSSHISRGGQYNPYTQILEVDAGEGIPIDPKELQIRLNHIRRVLYHELQHVGQDYLGKLLKLKFWAGVPAKAPGQANDWGAERHKPHGLRNVEFYPNLVGQIHLFRDTVVSQDMTQEQALKYRDSVLKTTSFEGLKPDPLKWRKAVAEYIKATDAFMTLHFSAKKVAARYLK